MTQTIRYAVHEYPKLLAFALLCVLAYFLFELGTFDRIAMLLNGYGYITMFFGGMMFAFGFTTPFAIVLFITLADTVHPLYGALIAATGSVMSDLVIFRFARLTLSEELHRLKTTRVLHRFIELFHHPRLSERIRRYLFWSFAGVIIASPLPDEVGVTILSSADDVDAKKLAVLSYCLNVLGIASILAIAGIA